MFMVVILFSVAERFSAIKFLVRGIKKSFVCDYFEFRPVVQETMSFLKGFIIQFLALAAFLFMIAEPFV